MSSGGQKIFHIRREYNSWVADETLEDYALRYTPRSFRKWSEWRVGNAAFGAVSFLALEAIGAAIALNYGFTNALWAILVVGLIILGTGLPISYYAARYGVDMDLLTRGAGFGYLGSTFTSLIYASFTFIFFALEAAIMGLAVQMVTDWPFPVCYVLSSVIVIPLVTYGVTLISRLQMWTQPVWLLLWVCPFVAVAWNRPEAFVDFMGLAGRSTGDSEFDLKAFGLAATVVFALVLQIGEQVDYLRFMPEKTRANRVRWWAAVLVAGPGWIVPGMLKMLAGAFLAFLVLQREISPAKAMEPTQMYLAGFQEVFTSPTWAMAATVVFVVISQIKINVTNAYAGSLAWSNFFARVTHSHPGRVVWLVFNVLIAVLLMTLGVFEALESVLGLYGNVAIAWVGALVADLIINKPMGWSPKGIEFRRAHLYDLNPVGLGATALAALVAVAAHAGALGAAVEPWAPFLALGLAMVTSPALAWATQGRYYLARQPESVWHAGQPVRCSVCDNHFEAEDMAACPAYDAPICSLCCTLESRCHDSCKERSRAAEQVSDALKSVLPRSWSMRINFGMGHYLLVFCSLAALLAAVLGLVYHQAGSPPLWHAFVTAYALLLLVTAVCAWWVVLTSESRRMAQDDAIRHNQLLQLEIDAHRRTDAALQQAKEWAESANQAKTRYVAGMTHELRTPLNSIMGYAQLLLKGERPGSRNETALRTIHRSGEHLIGLIDGALDLARIEAGRLRLDVAPVPLPAFLDDIVRMVQPQAAAKGLTVNLETQGRLPQWVQADAKRLRQILLNLMGNAVRFTQSGRVTLRLDGRREVLRFDVEDTGIGIAPRDMERIFLPFERGSAGRRSSEPGTGLGLTITHLLTELMGGELRVQSQIGEGSVFSVRLHLRELSAPPVSEAHRLTLVAQGGRSPLRPIIGYVGQRCELLVVDDQPLQRQLLAGLLLPLGFHVHEAASGHEALEALREQCPDGILMDISMGEIDGWETARAIRDAGFQDVPIVMVSANVFENRAENLAAAQCQGFIVKPVMESELLDTLGRVLNLHWLTEADAFSDPSAPADIPSESTPTAGPPPQDAIWELQRLARMGKLKALQQSLTEWSAQAPQHAALWQRLHTFTQTLDLDAIVNALQPHVKEEWQDE